MNPFINPSIRTFDVIYMNLEIQQEPKRIRREDEVTVSIDEALFVDEEQPEATAPAPTYSFQNGGYSVGKRTNKDASIFKGLFLNGIPVQGKITYPDGTVYKGELRDEKWDGKGTLYDSKKNVVTAGLFQNGVYMGNHPEPVIKLMQGTNAALTAFNNSKLQTPKFITKSEVIMDLAEVEQKKQTGILTVKHPAGKIYRGEFKNGTLCGYATCYTSDCWIAYEGELTDWKLNGLGKAYYRRGPIAYEGHYKDGIRNGQGKSYDNSGILIYKGEFKNGKYDGLGEKYTTLTNLEYQGEFKDDQYNGLGKLYHLNGNISYKGEFKDGQKHGQGTEYDDKGNVARSGIFENGVLKEKQN